MFGLVWVKFEWVTIEFELEKVFVGIPPPNDAQRTFPDDTWHTFLFGLPLSRFPQEDTWRTSPIRTSSGRGTLTEISLLYQNTQPFYVITLVKKNQRKSHYDFCSIPGIVLKDWLMKIVNTRINELFLFKSLSEKKYVNNVKLSKRN